MATGPEADQIVLEVALAGTPGEVTVTTRDDAGDVIITVTVDATDESFDVARVTGAAGSLSVSDITIVEFF